MVEVPASHSAYVSQLAPGHALRSSPATRARGSSTSATAGSPALDPLVGFAWVISRPVRQTATNQPVGIVAAIGHALARDGLTSWIDAAHVCAELTVDPCSAKYCQRLRGQPGVGSRGGCCPPAGPQRSSTCLRPSHSIAVLIDERSEARAAGRGGDFPVLRSRWWFGLCRL